MESTRTARARRIFAALGLITCLVAGSAAADVFVYPREGQSPEKQEQDEFACYKWAKAQSGVDPATAAQPTTDRGKRVGSALGGAARSAAIGAVVGEIVDDDAGKGAGAGAVIGAARGRRQAIDAEKEAATSRQSNYDRAFSVCMDARGYSVK